MTKEFSAADYEAALYRVERKLEEHGVYYMNEGDDDAVILAALRFAASRPPEGKGGRPRIAAWVVEYRQTDNRPRVVLGEVKPPWDALYHHEPYPLYASPPHPDDVAKAEREISAADVLSWLKARPGNSWASIIKDVEDEATSHLKGGKPTP